MRPRKRRIRAVIVLDHALRPSLEYPRPNEGADKGPADYPGEDAIRTCPRCGPHGNANRNTNGYPNAHALAAILHRPASVIKGFGIALCLIISTSGAPPSC